jgi:hypothetical protein
VLALAAIVLPSAQAQAQVGTDGGGEAAATRHHHPDVAQPPTRIVAITQPGGFDWGDAGIGAGSLLGAVLLIGGATLMLRRSKRVPSAGLW